MRKLEFDGEVVGGVMVNGKMAEVDGKYGGRLENSSGSRCGHLDDLAVSDLGGSKSEVLVV